MELKRVVVTGLGAVTPLGNTSEETWQNMLAGKSGAAPITSFDTTNFKTKFACEVKNLNINDYLDRKEARKMDRYTQLALIAAKQAVDDRSMDDIAALTGLEPGNIRVILSRARKTVRQELEKMLAIRKNILQP